MKKYILFDLDGTLTDPKEGIIKCFQHAIKAYGRSAGEDELMRFIGPPLMDSFKAYLGVDDAEAARAVEIYRERFAPIGIFENRAYDGVVDMLSALKSGGKILALATSKPQIFAEQIVERYGMKPYLSALVGSELDGSRTRKSEVILEALRQLGSEPGQAVMVGDRKHDIIGAKEAGVMSVGVAFGYAAPGELEEAGADKIVQTMPELTELLLGL